MGDKVALRDYLTENIIKRLPDDIKDQFDVLLDLTKEYKFEVKNPYAYYLQVKDVKNNKEFFMKIVELRNKGWMFIDNDEFNKILKKDPNNSIIPVIYYKDIGEVNDKKRFGMCISISDYYPNKELYYYISEQKLKEKKHIKHVIYQLTTIVKYLHSHNLVWCDIKPENILVMNDSFDIKVFDFETCVQLKSKHDTVYGYDIAIGTPGYYPPEYVFDYKLSQKYDIWCLGVVLFCIIYGRPLINETELRRLYKKHTTLYYSIDILSPKWNRYGLTDIERNKIDDVTYDLLRRTHMMDPDKRADADDILNHEYFKDSDHS